MRSPSLVAYVLEQVEVVLELRGQQALTLQDAAALAIRLIAAEDFNRLQLHEVLLGPRRIQHYRREQQERASLGTEDHRPRRLDVVPQPRGADVQQRVD